MKMLAIVLQIFEKYNGRRFVVHLKNSQIYTHCNILLKGFHGCFKILCILFHTFKFKRNVCHPKG